jgi:hypothetical protein
LEIIYRKIFEKEKFRELVFGVDLIFYLKRVAAATLFKLH